MYGHLAQWDERIGARSLCEGSSFCFICGQKEKGHYICDPDIAQLKSTLFTLKLIYDNLGAKVAPLFQATK